MIAALPYRALPPCGNALFLLGGLRESFSFVTKREAEKSRYFRGARLAAHNERRHPAELARSCASKPHWGFDCFATAQPRLKGAWVRAAHERFASAPLRIQERTYWPLPGANTLRLNGSQFLLFIANFWSFVGGGARCAPPSADVPGNLTMIAAFRANRRGGFHIRPGSLALAQDSCGRAMLAPTLTKGSTRGVTLKPCRGEQCSPVQSRAAAQSYGRI